MDTHVPSVWRLPLILHGATIGLTLLGSAASAAIEIEICTGDAAPAAVAAAAVKQAVDWTSLFLGEFAVGGPAENVYVMARRAACCLNGCADCQQPAHLESVKGNDDVPNGGWQSAGGHFTEDDTAVPEMRSAADSRRSGDRADLRGSGQEFRPAQPRPLTALSGGTAAEIIKLRRMVGKSPVAGTIFDAPHRDAIAWIGDTAAPAEHDLSNEETMADAIRRLEVEDSMVVEQPPRVMSGVPPAQWACDLLRPAERKLEEAADLLEQLGEYERADAARELARDVRIEARRHERQSCRPMRIDNLQSFQVPPHAERVTEPGDAGDDFTFGPRPRR